MKFMDWAKDMTQNLGREPESYKSWFEDLLDLLVRDRIYAYSTQFAENSMTLAIETSANGHHHESIRLHRCRKRVPALAQVRTGELEG